jgi:hypothetical protein
VLAFRIAVVSGLLSLLSWPSSVFAAPPEPEAAVAPSEGEPAPAEAPSEITPAEEPAAEEPAVEEKPVEGPTNEDVEPPKPNTHEARPAEEKLQIPVDIGDKHSITYTSLLAPRVNPLGLEERLWIGYQYRLYKKTGDIWRGSNIGIFLRPILSPAIGLIGPTVQFQPLAVLRFRATWSFVGWLGTFDYMQSYQSPHDDFSDTRLDEQTLKGENYATIGHQTELELLFQVRFKQVILRNTLTADYNSMKLRGDDDVYYDIRIDAMVPNNGWVVFNDTDLMWAQDFKGPRKATLLAGARATVIKSFYPDSVYEPGDPMSDPNGPIFRLGPNLGYIFYDRPDVRPRFNRPTLLLIPQWNILHRWRNGRDVHVGYPTITLAFVFTGQLWGKGK